MSTTDDLALVLGRDPRVPSPSSLTLRQAVVTAAAPLASPPSVTIELGGGSEQIPGVRYLSGYSPQVGDTVWVLRQGPLLIVLGDLA